MRMQFSVVPIILLLSFSIKAQDQGSIDSLKSVIDLAKHDTLVCDAYLRWGEQVYLINPDTAQVLWQQASDLAQRNLRAGHLTDALKKKYLTCLADTYNNIGFINYSQGNITNALVYFHKGLEIWRKMDNNPGIAACLNNLGAIYNNQGDNSKALEYYHMSLDTKKEMANSSDSITARLGKSGMAYSLNNIGTIYDTQGDVAKALEYYHKSLKIDEELGNKKGIATALNNIGYIYKLQGDITKALEYHHRSLKMKEETGNQAGIVSSLNNIGYIYSDQGNDLKAIEYYSKGLKIAEEIGNKVGISNSLNNLGSIYKNKGETGKALEYYRRSLMIDKEMGNKAGYASSLYNIGLVELNQAIAEVPANRRGALEQALKNGTQALKIAREIGSPDLISFSSYLISKVARLQGDFKEALHMYEIHITMRDSINNEETQKATIRQQTKYEFEKAQLVKEQEEKEAARIVLEATSRRDNLQYSVIFIAILVLFGGVLMLGFIKMSERMAEGLIFFSFLIFFEFMLVLADPYIENWSEGAPGIKLLFNACIAAFIFPLHAFFESKLKRSLVNK